jgi:phosphatidylserine/phosphatidylglycerophosphate/cardiolipin synthase-like enzyme
MDAFDLLTDADLTAVAAALRSGRLHAPFTAVSLQRFCPPAHAGTTAARLQQLREEGMQPQHLALLTETIIRTRARLPQQADLVDLVWTGPETLGVTNRDTGVVVRELFGAAESEVLVAGFAVYQGRSVFKRLAERMEVRPDLRVKLFLDVQRHPTDTSLNSEVLRRFVQRFRTQEWPGERLPELYYDPRSLATDTTKRSSLHAKCIVIDRQVAFVSSANFTEAAQVRNIEVGALIRSPEFATKLARHFEALAEAGMLLPMPLGA